MKKYFEIVINNLRSLLSKKILYILGIGAVSFIFEACYGVPQDSDLNKNYQLRGKLLTVDGNAAANVDVLASSSTDMEQAVTKEDGSFILNINGYVMEKVSLTVLNGKGQTTITLPADERVVPVSLKSLE